MEEKRHYPPSFLYIADYNSNLLNSVVLLLIFSIKAT